MGRKAKYDFSGLEVGDKKTMDGNKSAISVCAFVFGKKNNMKFSVKKVQGLVGSENGEQDAERVEITRIA